MDSGAGTSPDSQRGRAGQGVIILESLLISGTDTGVGKTWVTALLARRAAQAGCRVGVYKPVCSGALFETDGQPVWDDLQALSTATGDRFPQDLICPQRFLAPVAPPEAARIESRTVSSALLRDGARAWQDHCDLLLIEGAGGLLCPLSDDTTVADLAVDLQSQLLIVAANRLGVINHTLLTVAAAKSRGLSVEAVVLNTVQATEVERSSAAADRSLESNARMLRQWLPEQLLFSCEHGVDDLRVVSDGQGLTGGILHRLLNG